MLQTLPGQVRKKKKLKWIDIKQKHVRIIFNEGRPCHSWPLSNTLHALNIYQLDVYENLNFVR